MTEPLMLILHRYYFTILFSSLNNNQIMNVQRAIYSSRAVYFTPKRSSAVSKLTK